MFKAFFGSAAVFAILVFAMVAPAGVLKAQEAVAVREGEPVLEGVPEQAEAVPGEGVAVKAAPEEVVPADVPAEQELYRESQRQQRSTFVTEPQIKF